MARNVVRRALLQLVDPSPDKAQVSLIWDYFESRCAYCDRTLVRGAKEGHIDHLVSASANGRNHMANRVLACANCNEKEKRDADWRTFLDGKCPEPAIRAERVERIERWLDLQRAKGDPVNPELLVAAEAAAAEVAAFFNEKVRLLKTRLPAKSKATRGRVVDRPAALARQGDPRVKARYQASRLTFKPEMIEPLADLEAFRVDTPEGSFVMTKAEFYSEFPGVVASLSYRQGNYNYSVTPKRAFAYVVPAEPDVTLDQVVEVLARKGRRATYGAVGGVLGRPARFVMAGRPKDARHSWVVSAETGLPSGYDPGEFAPGLQESPPPISDARELVKLLRASPDAE